MREIKDYVTYEIAKLLREKEYDGEYNAYYTYYDDHSMLWIDTSNSSFKPYWMLCECKAPSLYDAKKWLREKHYLHIKINFDKFHLWGWFIYDIKNGNSQLQDSMSMFNSYEEALNNGIKEALKFI